MVVQNIINARGEPERCVCVLRWDQPEYAFQSRTAPREGSAIPPPRPDPRDALSAPHTHAHLPAKCRRRGGGGEEDNQGIADENQEEDVEMERGEGLVYVCGRHITE